MNGQGSKRRSNANRLPAFLVGFLLGGLAGTAALWLLPPGAGKKTRSPIQEQGKKLRHEMAAVMEAVVTEAGDKPHQFTDSVHAGVGDVQKHTKDMLVAGKK